MVVAIETQIRSLQLLRDKQCGKLLDRLMTGCVVEPGRHTAELRDSDRGSRRVFRLAIDGRLIR